MALSVSFIYNHSPNMCPSMHVRIIVNVRTNGQHTSELTGRKPPTLDARIYISAPTIWPSHNLKFELNSTYWSLLLHTEEIWEKCVKKSWIYAWNMAKSSAFFYSISASRENINYIHNNILLPQSSVCGLGGLVRARKENKAVKCLPMCCNTRDP